jgi:uroporphyrinogen-III synthase
MMAKKIPTINEPMIEIKKTPITTKVDKSDILVFTSANGINSFADQYNLRNNLIYTLSGNSYLTAQEAGFTKIFKAGNSAEELLSNLTQNEDALKAARVLHLSGDYISCDISKELKRLSISSERVICYQTIYRDCFSSDLEKIIREKQLAAVIFFSINTAVVFTRLLKRVTNDYQHISALAISNKIAIALKELKWENIAISEKITNQSICDLALKNYEARCEAF